MTPLHTSRSIRIASMTALLLLTACSTPALQVDRDGAPVDGLVPVRQAGLDEAWVKPGVKLSSYRQLLLAPVAIEYRPVRNANLTAMSGSNATEFPVSEADRQRLADTVTAVFREELARSHDLTLATAGGPGVLLVKVSLLDVVSRMPPEGPGRTDVYLDEIGAATLKVEVVDALSGELLARAVDQRTADAPMGPGGSNTLSRVTSVTAWSEVRRVVRRWAGAITRYLDELRTLD